MTEKQQQRCVELVRELRTREYPELAHKLLLADSDAFALLLSALRGAAEEAEKVVRHRPGLDLGLPHG